MKRLLMIALIFVTAVLAGLNRLYDSPWLYWVSLIAILITLTIVVTAGVKRNKRDG
ncbi:membrane protein YdbS with pleckstrin-like domain [Alkalibacillus flavidus]|uniref:Membrane protein YdbS with pleckstrin-like domain n=1 Tax=Alkalibacillus flavidus TaxID=546021 RepID=A0ABV2KUT5_9BACI